MSEIPPPAPQPVEAAPEDSIGERIAARRHSKGLTHDGLAKLTKMLDRQGGTGISRTTIRGYEVGLYKPGTRELRLLSQTLEVSPSWLIFGDAAEAPQPGASGGADSMPLGELQKFVIALPLLQGLDPEQRQVVYTVLHSLARMKLGETEYRGHVIAMGELGGVLADAWTDLREGRLDLKDPKRFEELMEAYQKHVASRIRTELGVDVGSLSGKLVKAVAGEGPIFKAPSPDPSPAPAPAGPESTA